jgi:hypothetical protein
MGADIEMTPPFISVIPQNAFQLDKKHNIFNIYVGKNNDADPSKIDLYVDFEIYLPAGMKESREILKYYVESFLLQYFDVFYLPDNILSTKKPSKPIPYVVYH